ncbi:MAG: xanthine dehydrogenase family protein subunit M [Chloroflexi bacterium]|nr:xanthine dehydrogenase family protein subunit M [Chloroflexota bacterium]MCI0578080.1 xanthine dehydrogenase family protein subunit M [Chloroflexota bacterium]MCI0646068.1 xanthine dehydrogenase family protein subunit M [Chloroflexota bacterium]MCI0730994.1 xanthine dehydrogenase family protein subunit M [Chloroflexota bacterium]
MKRFDYLTPGSLNEALEMLAQRPEAAPLAGGTNLLVQIKEDHRSETALLSLKRVSDLNHISGGDEPPHALVIGAGVTMKRIAADPLIQKRYPALAAAAGLIGSVQTRNMATVGGNLCNASPSADTAPPLLAFNAQAVLVSTKGERAVPLADFFTGPGTTVLQPGELLKELVIPAPAARTGSAYARHIPRAAMDISVVGVAVVVTLDADKTIREARITLGAVAPTSIRAGAAERVLNGRLPEDSLLAEAGSVAAGEARPVDDVRASVAYRRHLVNVLTQDALRQAIDNAES